MIVRKDGAVSSYSNGTSGKGKKGHAQWNVESIFKQVLIALLFFYMGVGLGWNMQHDNACSNCPCNNDSNKDAFARGTRGLNNGHNNNNNNNKDHAVIVGGLSALSRITKPEALEAKEKALDDKQAALKQERQDIDKREQALLKKEQEINRLDKATDKALEQLEKEQEKAISKKHHKGIFDNKHTGVYASGMEFVDRDEFAAAFDTGVPLDPTGHGNDRVTILYSENWAMPLKNATQRDYPSGPALSVEDATKNCNNLHVVLTSDTRRNQCIAIMGQYESFHLHKFMRLTDGPKQKHRNLDTSAPLRLVNRGMQLNGEKSISLPDEKHTTAFWKSLVSYLTTIDDVLKELKPVAEKVAAHNKHNTIIVLVCNLGHAEMLFNFVCHARAQGLEDALSNILLFSTDIETHQLATSMGLTSFYNEAVFGSVPSKAAKQYGDVIYSKIMGAKVYCVHLISMLGFDLLFQDIDVIWFKDPLEWFHKEDSPSKDFDMVFQDDGARTLFYAPYSANTGFYFVRNNAQTKFFWNSLLYLGDQIMSQSSHQNVLIVLLAEHASLYGLKVKTWNKNAEEFPGGHAYHQRKDFMKGLAARKNRTLGEPIADGLEPVDPYIFHMSWTNDKTDKLKFFAQMGDWYLKDTCTDVQNATTATYTPSNCCAAKPFIQCHFRDKPSVIPCTDSPPTTKENKPSFWQHE